MNWLFDNPVSEMPGPLFLALYAVVIVLVMVEASWRIRRSDPSGALGPEPIPSKPDPIEIAYLRGGENEVARLLVFDLIRRGYLEVDEKVTTISRAPNHPDVKRLSPIEEEAFGYFDRPRKPTDLFRPGGLASRIKGGLEPMADSLREAELLSPAERTRMAWKAWLGGALMILAVGGFKFAVALAKGKHNVVFLLVLAFLGLSLLGLVCRVPRLTSLGKDYLERLREAFEGLKPRVARAADAGNLDPALVLVPAVFGVSALVGTPYSFAPDLFKSAARTSGGGCGGGCGSSGGGGGGCGGGGCGGGGCGGCGGCGS